MTVLATTLLRPAGLARALGLDVVIASETGQHTGSFKFRAAYNLASSVPNAHVITASSGNFGQALAYACKLLGKRCTVVMPTTSAKVKIAAVRGHGATVELVDTTVVPRAVRVAELAAQDPAAYVASAYDDPYVIAGNASLGRELAAEGFDVVVAPVGGGGLTAGIIVGLREAGASTSVVGAEPLLANDAARSLAAGYVVANEQEPGTMADGARTVSLGKHNWEVLKTGLAGIVEVPEEAIARGVRLLREHTGLRVEPTGALAIAALLVDPDRFAGARVCAVASGGNVDDEVYDALVR
ncbi:MAG: pyridoxal-5-phosphate-dependent protein beta subunit [Cyanobacteria bacterium RYN_339]|nr:pyridoxal-5-phosphate-dependent protein beta subunit [Cyanobacteria bacterium RYN_339]